MARYNERTRPIVPEGFVLLNRKNESDRKLAKEIDRRERRAKVKSFFSSLFR